MLTEVSYLAENKLIDKMQNMFCEHSGFIKYTLKI